MPKSCPVISRSLPVLPLCRSGAPVEEPTHRAGYAWQASLEAFGSGPDRCIDAVGCEAHATGSVDAVVDKVKSSVMLASDRAHVLREAIMCCRKGGTISVPGAYVGTPDKLPFGAFMNKGLTMKSGQTHMQRYMKPLFEKIESGAIDPSFVITHRVKLANAPEAYKTFRDKKEGCIKVVLTP
jgi:threonine dehydrogenase-like Zn-dependent dehydrogenase